MAIFNGGIFGLIDSISQTLHKRNGKKPIWSRTETIRRWEMQWTWFATPDEPVAIGPPGMAGKGLGMAGWLGSKPTRHETRSIEVLEGGIFEDPV